MSEQVFQTRYETYRTAVESYLETLFAGRPDWRDLYESMRYSLLAGGKRIRPVLTLEFARLAGLADWKTALPMACALELVHTYSLIHDDLPCMDNDDLRRGKPTNHKVFGECTATLAGDALQALAFQMVLDPPLSDGRTLRCARLLARAAGPEGICGGQQMDLEWEGRALSEEELLQIHLHKTAALIRAACLMGVAAAGGTPEQEEAAAAFADHLGLAFQIRDDILDVTSTEEELGKPIGSDAANEKTTYVTLYGPDRCEELVLEHTRAARQALEQTEWPGDPGFLLWLAEALARRSK